MMVTTFRKFLEQGLPPMPPPPSGQATPGQLPDLAALFDELGIKGGTLKGASMVGAFTGPSQNDISNLRPFVVKAVDKEGKHVEIEFLPIEDMGSSLKSMKKSGGKWRIRPKGSKSVSKVVPLEYIQKIFFQDKINAPAAPAGGGGMLPGQGGMPMMNPGM